MLTEVTSDKLMVVTIKALFSENLDPDIKDFVLFAAYKNDLVNEQGEKTPKYFSSIDDDHEKLIRKLTGYQKKPAGLCACGCGRNPYGRSRYARAACRKKVSRFGKITDNTRRPKTALVSG